MNLTGNIFFSHKLESTELKLINLRLNFYFKNNYQVSNGQGIGET